MSERTILENGAHARNLIAPRSLATYFFCTSRFQNLKLHGLNLKRYDVHPNLSVGSKVMNGFPKLDTRGKPPTVSTARDDS